MTHRVNDTPVGELLTHWIGGEMGAGVSDPASDWGVMPYVGGSVMRVALVHLGALARSPWAEASNQCM